MWSILQARLPRPGPGVEDFEDADTFEGETDALRAQPCKLCRWEHAPGSAVVPLLDAIKRYMDQEHDPDPRHPALEAWRRRPAKGGEERVVQALDAYVISVLDLLLPPTGWKWTKLTVGACAEMLEGVQPPAAHAGAGPSTQRASAPTAGPAAVGSGTASRGRKLTPDYLLRRVDKEGACPPTATAGGGPAAGGPAAGRPAGAVPAAGKPAEGEPAEGSSWPARILEILAVGEVKQWSKLMRGGSPVDILQLFNPSSSDPLSRSVVRIVAQLWTHMLAAGVEFGFLSCFAATWLFCRPLSEPDDQLLVSEPFLHSVTGNEGVTVLAALSWLQDQAMQRTHAEQRRHAFKRISITQAQEAGGAAQAASLDAAAALNGSGEIFTPGGAGSDTSERSAKRLCTRGSAQLGHAPGRDPGRSSTPDVPSSSKPGVLGVPSSSSTPGVPGSSAASVPSRSAPGVPNSSVAGVPISSEHNVPTSSKQEVPSSSSSKPDAASSSEHKVDIPVLPSHALHLGGHTLGMGSSCEVVRGAYLGAEAAVKLLDCDDPWQAAVREGAMYQVLHGLQGGVIPRLFGIGKVAAGFAFIAVSVVEGVPLSQLPGSISRGVQDAAKAALRRVHEQGVAHNDIWLANFMLRRHAGAGPRGSGAGAGPGVGAGAGPAGGEGAGCEVVLIDLGRAYKCSCRATLDGEMATLRRLLSG